MKRTVSAHVAAVLNDLKGIRPLNEEGLSLANGAVEVKQGDSM